MNYTYDAVGSLTRYTDRTGSVTEYAYDGCSRLIRTENALGGVRTTAYDALGRAIQTVDENGGVTAMTYDAVGNLLTVTDALGGVVTYTYDALNRVDTVTDKLGHVTACAYDVMGRLTAVTDPAGGVTRYVYDANGNVTSVTNRANEQTRYEYDEMNRVTKEIDPLNHAAATYAYDLAGNRVSVTDAKGNTTAYEYDGLNRVISVTDPLGGVLEYSYADLGGVATLTADGGDGTRGTTSYEYDDAGNLTGETSPLGFTTSYTCDEEGNVLMKTDANGSVTAYAYDALHRMTSRTDADGTASYAYDAAGNLLSATDASGTVAFAYDALSRTTAVTNEDGTTTAYAYDANGNRLSITYPDGKAVTTVYDALGNAASITDHDGTGVVYTRDAEGRVTKEAYSDGSSTEYDYNAAGQLVQQKEVTPEHVTRRQTVYTYDDAGNLTSENRAGVGVAPADEFARYWYDAAGQLIKTTLEGETTEYTYDLAGNLVSDGESTYTYDVQNRLLTKVGADGTVNYTYDAAGNLVSDGATTYTYNAQNKLIRGENADGESSTYVYNALGARIENVQVRKNENAGHANAALDSGSRYARDYTAALSDNRAAWQRVWETEAGTVVQNDFETVTKHYVVDYLSAANRDIFVTEDGSFTQRYVYDAVGKRLSVELDYADGTMRGEAGENPASDIAVNDVGKVWYRVSALNSTLFAVDADGAIVAHMIYDPWGVPLCETYTDANFSGLDNLNNFTGYTWDETLGLYFAQNRFYDAEAHRFTQEDALRDGGNWYAYCGNNPLVYVDPWGQAKSWQALINDHNRTASENLKIPTYVPSALTKKLPVSEIMAELDMWILPTYNNGASVVGYDEARGTYTEYSFTVGHDGRQAQAGRYFFRVYCDGTSVDHKGNETTVRMTDGIPYMTREEFYQEMGIPYERSLYVYEKKSHDVPIAIGSSVTGYLIGEAAQAAAIAKGATMTVATLTNMGVGVAVALGVLAIIKMDEPDGVYAVFTLAPEVSYREMGTTKYAHLTLVTKYRVTDSVRFGKDYEKQLFEALPIDYGTSLISELGYY